MAFYTLHAYDADVWIPEFRGLNQADIQMNPDTRFAAEEENVETVNGVLQPQAALGIMTMEGAGDGPGRIETLACFHRRWYKGSGSKDFYVCCSGGKFYFRQANSTTPWQAIDLPSGVEAYQSSVWSWVTYEINPVSEDDEPLDTVDVLLFSNNLDGMIMIVPPDMPTSWQHVKEHTWQYHLDLTWLETMSPAWHILTVDTNGMKFGVIERYAERIWACDVADNPDKLVYSAPYDPTNWEADVQIPEDGAGEILQPTWDGDRFYALKRFGDHLLAFKKNGVWRIIGTSPGEYAIQEQHGCGTSYFNTIAVETDRVFMETADGLSVYDGARTTPYAREAVEGIWKTVNRSALDQMCAVLYKNRYYVAVPTGDSAENNAVIMYNLTEGTILYYTGMNVESFLPTDEYLFFTGSDGNVYALNYDSWTLGAASGKATRWVSPWMDFGRKSMQKGGFDLYIVPEVRDEAVTLKISIQTEKKKKTKNYTVQPLTEAQREAEREHRGKRLHFGGTGRKFRVIIETEDGVTAPWRLIGGVQIIVETDPD